MNDEFRKQHKVIITINGPGTTNETEPLPDLDFSANDYIILWTDDMLRKVEVTPGENSLADTVFHSPGYTSFKYIIFVKPIICLLKNLSN